MVSGQYDSRLRFRNSSSHHSSVFHSFHRHVTIVTGFVNWPEWSFQRRVTAIRLADGSAGEVVTSTFSSAPGRRLPDGGRELCGGGLRRQFVPRPGGQPFHRVFDFQQRQLPLVGRPVLCGRGCQQLQADDQHRAQQGGCYGQFQQCHATSNCSHHASFSIRLINGRNSDTTMNITIAPRQITAAGKTA